MKGQCRRRKGFSLIELLVVIAVIGLLVALILPAVQSARESARRVQCQNQMRQLGLAFHSFENTEKAFPSLDLGKSWATWAVLILPYVEQRTLFTQWDLAKRYYVQPAQAGDDLAMFHCPSRSGTSRPKTGSMRVFSDGLRIGPCGWSDYGACWGTARNLNNGAVSRAIDLQTRTFVSLPTNPSSVVHPGWIHPIRVAMVTDGLSNTLLLGEMHIPPTFSSKMDVVFNGDNQGAYSRLAGHEGVFDSSTGKYGAERRIINDPTYSSSDWSDHFGSAHPGSCNFAFADGGVRALSNQISIEPLHRLACRDDGLIVADFGE